MLDWMWLLFLPMCFGMPLGAVGVVLLLCEWSWEKPAGSMGSRWLLGCAVLLCLPWIFFLGAVVVDLLK